MDLLQLQRSLPVPLVVTYRGGGEGRRRDTRVAAVDTEYDFAQGTREGEQNLTILLEREGREK